MDVTDWGIREYDHPREIIVDLSRSIYREIHNLFNLGRQIRKEREKEREREGRGGKIRDYVARVKKIDRSANTRTRCHSCRVIVRKE